MRARWWFSAFWLLAVASCGGGGGVSTAGDGDGDGVPAAAGDCNDDDDAIGPGVDETCDGIDEDCDGSIDEDFDLDRDGQRTCDGDCDDEDPAVSDAGIEVCNGRDDDCDGAVDDGFDGDGDGVAACAGDCDDDAGGAAPDFPEMCDDLDNDCDGAVDEAFDLDLDGITTCEGDCDDFVAGVHPGATEVCDLDDNDCDAMVDEGLDGDGDAVTLCEGDCNDGDGAIFPDNPEIDDNKDNDCSGLADEPFNDDDADGYSETTGDCDDAQQAIGPDSVELAGNGLDDDCDGATDEARTPCDTGITGSQTASDYAKAIGLCEGEVNTAAFVTSTGSYSTAFQSSRAVVAAHGTNATARTMNRPTEGASMAMLTCGRAGNFSHDTGTAFDGNTGTTFSSTASNPDLTVSQGCGGGTPPATVYDLMELRLTIRVPWNATSFTYDFQFLSSEYPTYHCSLYNDSYLAELVSTAYTGNISFDAGGNVISVNNGFFDICAADHMGNVCDTSINEANALAGTGYNVNGGSFSSGSGATTRLVTTAPVTPGELITLRFIIFDEGDDILDSSVVLDNFLWGTEDLTVPITRN